MVKRRRLDSGERRHCSTWIAALPIVIAVSGTLAAQSGGVRIRTDRFLDGTGRIVSDTTIVVEGSRIAALEAAGDDFTYDLRGLTVLPGLIDTHVHLGAHFDPDGRAHRDDPDESGAEEVLFSVANAYRTLMAGFTTVQSLSSEHDREVRDAIARGAFPGPRVLTSVSPVTAETGTPAEIRAFVERLAGDGADAIKIFGSASARDGGGQTLTDAQLEAACGTAAELGLRSLVHAHGPDAIRAAILAGCTTIEHGSNMTDAVIELMAETGTWWDPHFGLVIQNYMDNRDRYLGIGNFTAEGFAAMGELRPLVLDTLRRVMAAGGVRIVYGTDAVAGAHGRNHEELIYRVRDAGQDPMAAIVSATSLAAQSLGLEAEIGSIAAGMAADIIAVDGNPLDDINAIGRVVFVMKDGRVFRNEAPHPPARR